MNSDISCCDENDVSPLCLDTTMAEVVSAPDSGDTSLSVTESRHDINNSSMQGKATFSDFRDQCAVINLNSLAGESENVDLPRDQDIVFKTRNPCYYPIASRSNVLDDFQMLIETDLKELYQRNLLNNKLYKNLSQAHFRAINELKENPHLVIRQGGFHCGVGFQFISLYGNDPLTG